MAVESRDRRRADDARYQPRRHGLIARTTSRSILCVYRLGHKAPEPPSLPGLSSYLDFQSPKVRNPRHVTLLLRNVLITSILKEASVFTSL